MAAATNTVKTKVAVKRVAAPRPAASPPAKTTVRAENTVGKVPIATPVKAPVAMPVKASRPDKPKKPKLVRDSFTIPKVEYLVLERLKQRAVKLGAPTKKSELLRAGIKALAAMTDMAFLAAVGVVPAIKTGRPAKV